MLCQLSWWIETAYVTEIQTEVGTAAEARWSADKSLCKGRPRLGSSPAQRTIVFGAASTVLMSWRVLPRRAAAVAAVVKLDRPFSLKVRSTNKVKDKWQDRTIRKKHSCAQNGSFTMVLIWILFGSHLHGSWCFSCVTLESGSPYANQPFFVSFNLTCPGCLAHLWSKYKYS